MAWWHFTMRSSFHVFLSPSRMRRPAAIMHWLVTPFVVSQWVHTSWWPGIVSVLWSLNLITTELGNPFGVDANDLDGHQMQKEMIRFLPLVPEFDRD